MKIRETMNECLNKLVFLIFLNFFKAHPKKPVEGRIIKFEQKLSKGCYSVFFDF